MANIDLTASGSSTTIDGAIFADSASIGAGTGNYNTFLSIQNSPSEFGFNADATSVSNPDIKSSTHTVLLSTVPITIVNGIAYYEFRVDLNESNNSPEDRISLDAFKIYTSTNGAITDKAVLDALTPTYNMDAGGDVSLLLSDIGSSGSGNDDYSVLVPVSKFGAVDPATTYLYLYVEMGFVGGDYISNATFEEWNLQDAGTLTGIKFEDANGDGVKQASETGVQGVTIFIDNNFNGVVDPTDNNGVLDAGERSTVTDINGNYTFYGVPLGTWRVDEVTPAGQTQTTGAFETVTLGSVGAIVTVDPIGNFIPHPSLSINKTGTVPGGTANVVGEVVSWTIDVGNAGNVAVAGVTVTDPLASDIAPVLVAGFNSGDTDKDNLLDVGETWHYTASHTVTQADLDTNGGGDGDIDNVATAHGTGAADVSDDATVPVAQNPDLTITKAAVVEDGHADHAGDLIDYTVVVTNAGNITLTNVVLTDIFEGGAPLNLTNFNSATNTFAGDTDGDGKLDVGEIWTYTYKHTVTQNELDTRGINGDGSLDNVASVTTDQTGPDSDDAHIPVELGPGVRTPGFWAQNTGQNKWTTFWDGITGNEPKQAGTNGFPGGEITYAVDSNHDGVVNGSDAKGLLVGDFNLNGIEDGGEHVLFISTSDALSILNASQKLQGDMRFVLGRDVVATWLNYLEGNGIGTAADLNSPRHYIDDSAQWLNFTTNGDDTLTVAELSANKVAASSPIWQSPSFGLDLSGSQLHSGLDEYNNHGTILGVHYASA
jgi:uncharacterized repeat protein (TIGR01451 family)